VDVDLAIAQFIVALAHHAQREASLVDHADGREAHERPWLEELEEEYCDEGAFKHTRDVMLEEYDLCERGIEKRVVSTKKGS
jgi:hypothetical protein